MEKKMIKLMLPILTLCLMSIVEAGYVLTIPLEQSMGGPLPSGSINISPRPPSLPTENWQPAESLYSEWINVNDVYGCSNWTPDTATLPIGVIFQQTTDCKQDQTITKQEREKETTTLVYRNVGKPTTETKSITVQLSRQATGIKETWVTSTAIYTDWVNSGEIYGCTFLPEPATIEDGISFTQSAMGCSQNKTRLKQDREQEVTTLLYREVGEAIIETSEEGNLNATRPSTGTMHCKYTNNEYAMKVGSGWLFKLNGSWKPNTGTAQDGYYYNGMYYFSGSYVGLVNGETRHKICNRLSI
jgi:hypothetical protein